MAFPTSLSFRPCCLFHSRQSSAHSQFRGHRSTARGINSFCSLVLNKQGSRKCGPLMPASKSPGELVMEEISSAPPRPTYLECLGAGPRIHILSSRPHPHSFSPSDPFAHKSVRTSEGIGKLSSQRSWGITALVSGDLPYFSVICSCKVLNSFCSLGILSGPSRLLVRDFFFKVSTNYSYNNIHI